MEEKCAWKPEERETIPLNGEMEALAEEISEEIHNAWARKRIADGWTWGLCRSDEKKETPCLVAYNRLPESEKAYDRAVARCALQALLGRGYEIRKTEVAPERK